MKYIAFFPTLIFFLSVCAALTAGYFYTFEDLETAKQPYVYWSGASMLTYAVLYL